MDEKEYYFPSWNENFRLCALHPLHSSRCSNSLRIPSRSSIRIQMAPRRHTPALGTLYSSRNKNKASDFIISSIFSFPEINSLNSFAADNYNFRHRKSSRETSSFMMNLISKRRRNYGTSSSPRGSSLRCV